MLRSRLTSLLTVLLCAATAGSTELLQTEPPQSTTTKASSRIVLPTGTKVAMVVTRPIWAKTAKPGDTLYSQTVFPVSINGTMAIPSGSYIEGVIDDLTRPTRRKDRATLSVHFTKIIFANGYTVVLPKASSDSTHSERALVVVQVSTANDLLLDNGAQIELTLTNALKLNATQAAKAILLSNAPQPGQFRSATLCRPTAGIPGSPGTPDTVIPGTPGTAGTPDSPGTPGTPDTVVPGTPGTPDIPGTYCPAAPLVLSSDPPAPSSSTNTLP
jgi:hypothetical protein